MSCARCIARWAISPRLARWTRRRCARSTDRVYPLRRSCRRAKSAPFARVGFSLAVLAAHIGATTGLVSKSKRGEKRPGRTALKLLALVKNKDLDAIAWDLGDGMDGARFIAVIWCATSYFRV